MWWAWHCPRPRPDLSFMVTSILGWSPGGGDIPGHHLQPTLVLVGIRQLKKVVTFVMLYPSFGPTGTVHLCWLEVNENMFGCCYAHCIWMKCCDTGLLAAYLRTRLQHTHLRVQCPGQRTEQCCRSLFSRLARRHCPAAQQPRLLPSVERNFIFPSNCSHHN